MSGSRRTAGCASGFGRSTHEVKGRYGSPRVHQELRALGIPCGKHRVARLMRAEGLRAKSTPRCRVTTQSDHAERVAPNVLARQFGVETAGAPDRVWVADLTYIATREGWLYLAVMLDLATRRVVGWALRTRVDQELALARAPHGPHASRRARRRASFRSRRAVREWRLSSAPPLGRLYAEHESGGELLGQRGRREASLRH